MADVINSETLAAIWTMKHRERNQAVLSVIASNWTRVDKELPFHLIKGGRQDSAWILISQNMQM